MPDTPALSTPALLSSPRSISLCVYLLLCSPPWAGPCLSCSQFPRLVQRAADPDSREMAVGGLRWAGEELWAAWGCFSFKTYFSPFYFKSFYFYYYFKDFIYLFMRHRERQRHRQRRSRLPEGSPMWDLIPRPWDHARSQRQMFNH